MIDKNNRTLLITIIIMSNTLHHIKDIMQNSKECESYIKLHEPYRKINKIINYSLLCVKS